MIAVSCFSLVFRLILHFVMGASAVCVCVAAWVVLKIRRQITADGYPDTEVLVIKVKTIPLQMSGYPGIQQRQRNYCWIQYMEDKFNDPSFAPSANAESPPSNLDKEECGGTGVVENEKSVGQMVQEIRKASEELRRELQGWTTVPCVVTDNAQQGDILTVRLLEGDPLRPVYLPYQQHLLKTTICKSLYAVLVMTAVAVLLYFSYDAPIIFAGSSTLEASINTRDERFWRFLGLDDDDPQNEDLACQIPWYVGVGYDVWLVSFIVVPVFAMYLKIRNAVAFNVERPGEDAYKLLDDGGVEGDTAVKGTFV